MRFLIALALLLITNGAMALFSGPALADEAEGKIRAVDAEQLTITLADGTSYKLPGEFDVDALREGMDVLLAYDEVDGEKLITDMQLSE